MEVVKVVLTIISAIGAFLVTNIDDIFVLMLLFSQAKATTSNGIGYNQRNNVSSRDIVLGQYLGFSLLVIISLLGTFGVMLIPDKWVGLLGLIPIYLGIKLFIEGEDEDEGAILSGLGRFNTFLLSVAFITFANGGDNMGIYVPFFSTLNTGEIVITVITFLVMVGIWCFLGYRLSRFRHVSETLEKYGQWIIPVVFVSLGIYIMIETGTMGAIIDYFQ